MKLRDYFWKFKDATKWYKITSRRSRTFEVAVFHIWKNSAFSYLKSKELCCILIVYFIWSFPLCIELQDNWIQAREPVLDGVTFCVKFLGSTLIDKTGASDAAEATKTVIQMVKLTYTYHSQFPACKMKSKSFLFSYMFLHLLNSYS